MPTAESLVGELTQNLEEINLQEERINHREHGHLEEMEKAIASKILTFSEFCETVHHSIRISYWLIGNFVIN